MPADLRTKQDRPAGLCASGVVSDESKRLGKLLFAYWLQVAVNIGSGIALHGSQNMTGQSSRAIPRGSAYVPPPRRMRHTQKQLLQQHHRLPTARVRSTYWPFLASSRYAKSMSKHRERQSEVECLQRQRRSQDRVVAQELGLSPAPPLY